jgi:gliding motility-associated-like protein
MKARRILIAAITTVFSLTGNAQRMAPTATYLDENNSFVDSSVDFTEQAPLDVTFRANPENIDDHTAAFEWHFRKEGDTQDLMVRYEEDTQYRFVESGTFNVTLKARLTDNGVELDSAVIKVTISESRLVMPNAFSPNDDLKNDIYGAKGVCDPNSTEHYRSIVEFHGYIFNRWGQKLFEWTDVSKGWDGKHNGTPVKDGVYYVLVKAKGADGRVYNIKKDINLLRGYTTTNGGSSTGNE